MLKALDFEEILRAGRWFGGLDRDFQAALLDAATVKKLGKEERLFARGDAPNGLYGLVQGTIPGRGTSRAVSRCCSRSWSHPCGSGRCRCSTGSPRTHDAVAGDEVDARESPRHRSRPSSREPRHWRDVAILAATRLRIMYSMAEDAGQPSPFGSRAGSSCPSSATATGTTARAVRSAYARSSSRRCSRAHGRP